MHWEDGVNAFQFKDYSVFDKQIHAESIVKVYILVSYRQSFLTFYSQASF